MSIFLILLGVYTHNLEVLWEREKPPYSNKFAVSMSSGDLDGNGKIDIVVAVDTMIWTSEYTFYCQEGAKVFFSSPLDTIPDLYIKTKFGGDVETECMDINADGFDDIILGFPYYNEGRVNIYLGGKILDTVSDFTMRGRNRGAQFGHSLANLGDVNGDGYDDLGIGSIGHDWSFKGVVFVYFGGPLFDTRPDFIFWGGHDGDEEQFGATIAGGHDLNLDGYDDVVIGAQAYGPSIWGNGRIYVYFGGEFLDTIYDVAYTGYPNEQIGGIIGGEVDIIKNKRGTADVAFASCYWPPGEEANGKLYVLYGSTSKYPIDSIPDMEIIGRTDSSKLAWNYGHFGAFTSGYRGREDIILGAPKEKIGKRYGTTYLYFYRQDTTPDAWISGRITSKDTLVGPGWYIARGGDVDKDGREEFLVSNYAAGGYVWLCKVKEVGIEEVEKETKIFNVSFVKDRFILNLNTRKEVVVNVIDAGGRVIKRIKGREKICWELKDEKGKKVPKGVYFLIIEGEYKGKLVVVR